MSSKYIPYSQGTASTKRSILENDNLTLATNSANISLDNAVRLIDAPSRTDPVFMEHVFKLLIAYNELDVLARSVGVSHEVAGHAKSLYSQVYNFSDFEGHRFQHDTLVAACIYIACSQKDQRRTMPEVFKSSHATTQQMLSSYETLKNFFAFPPETRRLHSEADIHLQYAYKEIVCLSDSNSIPPHASTYAKHLYKKVHGSDSTRDQDQRLIIASCLLIACRGLKTPRTFQEIFAMDSVATQDHIGKTFKSLEVFFTAENNQKLTEILNAKGTVTDTVADARAAGRIVDIIQEVTEQLELEVKPDSINRRNAAFQASFAPTAPSPASIATTEGKNMETDTTTAPAAPLVAKMAHAFHDSAENAVSTLPPTVPATVAGRKDAPATHNTLYNVICCQCKKILNLQNIHYAFYCLNCKHKRCDKCTMQAV